MKAKSGLLLASVAAVAGAFLFETSYAVQELEEDLHSLNRKIVSEQESIQVLKAEWSLLNDPARLEALASRHLGLQPLNAVQIATLDAVPHVPAPTPEPQAPAQPTPYIAGVEPAPGVPATLASNTVAPPRLAPQPPRPPRDLRRAPVLEAAADVQIARLGGNR